MKNDCHIYLTSKISFASFETEIKEFLLERKELSNSSTCFTENEDYDKRKQLDFPDGFLFFKYILEIELSEVENENVLLINDVLKWLWERDIPAIATCDFEDKLVNQGGYKNGSVPFPSKKTKKFWF